MRFTTRLGACAAALLAGIAAAPLPSPEVLAALAAPDRPAADTSRDPMRHPGELVAFAGIKSGDSVADLIPGKGYFTRIFSHVVGPQGHVYAVTPSELAEKKPELATGIAALAKQPPYGNVTAVVQPTARIASGMKLDVVWTDDNYHDLYGFFGARSASAADASIFAALKPGGVFVVVDHVGLPGSSDTAPTTLHRIDPATVKAQVIAAGFVFDGESPILRNPADAHTAKVFDPAIRGRTDQFAYRFRKPAG